MVDHCLFCKIVAGDAPASVVFETDNILAFRDIRPVAPTHILVIPKKHIATLADLEGDDATLIGEVVRAAKTIAEQEGIGGGFRLVVNNGRDAGQSIFHIHFHLLGGRRLGWPPG